MTLEYRNDTLGCLFVCFLLISISLLYISNRGRHSGTVVGTSPHREKVPGLIPVLGVFLCGVSVLSLCLRGFSPCTPPSSHSQQHAEVHWSLDHL